MKFTIRAFLIVAEFVLCIVLLIVLKKNLNHYYLTARKNIIILANLGQNKNINYAPCNSINSIFFHLNKTEINFDPEMMLFYGTWADEECKGVILDYIIDFLVEMPIYIYAFLNIRNINFQLYLYAIMSGYQIHKYYAEASIQIIFR